MNIPVIVMGAAGRMGATLARQVREASDLELVGVVERPERLESLAGLGCAVAGSLADILPKNPGAVVVDFTAPGASLATGRIVAAHKGAHVIGTTGFSDAERKELEELAVTSPVFWSPNMSIGINVIVNILPELTRLLGEAYDVDMTEIHHNKKKDAPSGTAMRLAEVLAKAKGWKLGDAACYHREGIIGERPKEEIGIQTLRGGDVVGVHTVYFMGAGERIELTHHAQSRDNFASGALRAVRWMRGRAPGRLYSMQDIL